MPYIAQNHRSALDKIIKQVPCALSAGEFNYLLAKIMIRLCDGGGYQRINDVTGALECCKLEFYRRLAAPYEDKKIAENGDVFGPNLKFNVYIDSQYAGTCELAEAPSIGQRVYYRGKWYDIIGLYVSFVSFLRLIPSKIDAHLPKQFRGILPIRES